MPFQPSRPVRADVLAGLYFGLVLESLRFGAHFFSIENMTDFQLAFA